MSVTPDHQSEALEQFKAICDLGADDSENASRLLAIHNYDLNNAVSQYFDSGFEAINPSNEPAIAETETAIDEGITSGAEVHEQGSLSHRRTSHNDVVNLQSQMFMDALMPRLPKAPRLSTAWHLEVGIHASLLEDSKILKRSSVDPEKSEDGSDSSPRKPWRGSLWIILLIIPKTLLQLIISAVRYLFGSGISTKIIDPNRFPKSFDYSKYSPEFRLETPEELEASHEDDSTSVPSETTSRAETEKTATSTSQIDSLPYNFQTSFNDAYDISQKKYVWFLIILINDSTESKQFVSKTLNNSHFNTLFNSQTGTYKDTLIYVNNVEASREAYEIGSTYKVKKLPYVMLVGNISTNPQTILSSMSILYKSNLSKHFIIEENQESTVGKISNNLSKLLESFTPQMISARFDQQEIEFARLIKQQQDDAYVQSLERDRVKKLQKQQEAEQTLAIENASSIRKLYLYKQIRSGELIKPDSSVPGATARIALKLPNGKRLVETVNKSLPVAQLYLYVETKLFELEEELTEGTDYDSLISEFSDDLFELADKLSLESYFKQYPFKFELVQPFPKRVYEATLDPISHTKELTTGANLLVEYTQDEEDEDDEE